VDFASLLAEGCRYLMIIFMWGGFFPMKAKGELNYNVSLRDVSSPRHIARIISHSAVNEGKYCIIAKLY
jgi:hypothetical protein